MILFEREKKKRNQNIYIVSRKAAIYNFDNNDVYIDDNTILGR